MFCEGFLPRLLISWESHDSEGFSARQNLQTGLILNKILSESGVNLARPLLYVFYQSA
jgi:hypothetical protein